VASGLLLGLLVLAGGCLGSAAALAGLGAELSALFNAPAVEWPATGATALANTYWTGTQTCELSGDFTVEIGGLEGIPSSDYLEFDEQGFPTEVSGMTDLGEITGDIVQLKRAEFTATSFDVAYTMTVSGSGYGASFTEGAVVTLTGELSPDGQTLTGTRKMGVFYLYSAGLPSGDASMSEECSFTLTRAE